MNPTPLWIAHRDLPPSLQRFRDLPTERAGYALATKELIGLLEEASPQPKPPHLLLYDLRTFAYPLLALYTEVSKQQMAGYGATATQTDSGFYTDGWGQYLLATPQPVLAEAQRLQDTQDPAFIRVLVDDCPSLHPDYTADPGKAIYWRHLHAPDYKGGRPPKPEGFSLTTSAAYAVAAHLGIPLLKEPYFEADDLVAQCVRERKELGVSGVTIWTVDTDLLQLVTPDSDCPVTWYNTPYAPRFRDYQGTLRYWEKRWKTTLEHPSQIAAFKAEHGDASDNLPPGTDIGLIDLWNPAQLPECRATVAINSAPMLHSTSTALAREYEIRAMLAGSRVKV